MTPHEIINELLRILGHLHPVHDADTVRRLWDLVERLEGEGNYERSSREFSNRN